MQQLVEVVTLGELLVDMISLERNVTLFDSPGFKPEPGGAPANVAVGVRRLGRSSAFIGKVGTDEFGQGLIQTLEAEGVDTRNLIDDPESLTTLAFVSLSESGNPHFAFSAGAHTRLQPDDLDVELIRQAKIFHFGSVSLAHEPVRTATLAALKIAKDAGVLCSYDMNWRPALWSGIGPETAIEPLDAVDVVKMNADELRLITGKKDVHEGLAKLDLPVLLTVITMAEQGCLYRFNGKIYHQPAFPVDKVIDATAAGDAFMAALLAGLRLPLDEEYLARLMARACKAGAITTTRRGAIAALPYAHELEEGRS